MADSHCTKPNPWKLYDRSALGVLLILVALSLLGWVYLTQASHVATTSRRVQKLEVEKARLQQENLQLVAEIADLESVYRLGARAGELGFVVAMVDESEFLVVADVVPPPAAEQTAALPAGGWWDNVASQFTAWAQVGAE